MGLSSEARQIFSWCRRLFPSVLSNWWDIGEKLTYTMFSFIFCFVIFRFCSCRSCQYQNAIGILKLCIAFTVPNTAFQMFSHVFIQKLAFLFRNGEKRTQLIYKSPGSWLGGGWLFNSGSSVRALRPCPILPKPFFESFVSSLLWSC